MQVKENAERFPFSSFAAQNCIRKWTQIGKLHQSIHALPVLEIAAQFFTI
jgi:hypothetical protein